MDDWFEVIRAFYKLKHEEAFDELAQLLFEFSCRDQEGEPSEEGPSKKELTDRRSDGHQLAKSMRDHAQCILTSLSIIRGCLYSFNYDVVRSHPPLLEAIFDIDTGDPSILFIPDEIAILQDFYASADWQQIVDPLTRMAQLPVRVRLEPGPVPNITLRRAVSACRSYWKDVEGKSWTMSALKNPENASQVQLRPTNAKQTIDTLQGECETFVAQLLYHSGLRLSLRDLSSAWVAVDTRARARRIGNKSG